MKKIMFAGLLALFTSLIGVCAGAAATSPDEVFKMIELDDTDGIRLAISQGFEINKIYGERAERKTALLEAIRLLRPEIVEILLKSGADTELRVHNEDYTPLMSSILWSAAPYAPKNTEISPDLKAATSKIFDALIENKASVNDENTSGGVYLMTPLGFAASLPYYEPALELTRKLLQAGAEVNPAGAERSGGLSPLFWAISTVFADWDLRHENRAELIKLLLDAGANPNARLGDGDTPLHYAIVDYDIVKILLDYGADKSASNKDGKTPRDIAAEKRNAEVVSLLESR
jgi:ankyrin repeat protein